MNSPTGSLQEAPRHRFEVLRGAWRLVGYGGVILRLHVAVRAGDLALDAPVLLASHRALDALGALGTALVVPRAPPYNPLCSWFEA